MNKMYRRLLALRFEHMKSSNYIVCWPKYFDEYHVFDRPFAYYDGEHIHSYHKNYDVIQTWLLSDPFKFVTYDELYSELAPILYLLSEEERSTYLHFRNQYCITNESELFPMIRFVHLHDRKDFNTYINLACDVKFQKE